MSVYFITCRERGICKIGYTGNAKARRSSLQTATPHKLTLEATLPGSRELERQLHERFSAHRISGEWFTITDELETLIRGAASADSPEIKVAQTHQRETLQRLSLEEAVEQSIARDRRLLDEALRIFKRLGPSAPHVEQRPRFYRPVSVGGGAYRERFAVRGQGAHRHRLLCGDMDLTWDQADRLCDILEEVRRLAVEEATAALDLDLPRQRSAAA